MSASDLPEAVQLARSMLLWATGEEIPAHRINFELTTPPDQYRVSWLSPRDAFEHRALVLRITLNPHQFEAWKTWLDAPQGETP